MISNQNNIGIGNINPLYIEVGKNQDLIEEYRKIIIFLNKYIDVYSEKNNINREDIELEFINYGKTELVYALKEKIGKIVTILVKQPKVKYGDIYKEACYLKDLGKKHNNIIEPIEYFTDGYQELYTSPYINQARCVASLNNWGMYIPEPYYRFVSFTEEQESIVCQCMIAKLITMYDFEKKEGISKCKLGGGDFILPKGWEYEIPTIDNTYNNLYLIACRDKIKCSFKEYIDIIISEFTKSTINKDENSLNINIRGRVPIKINDLNNGINLGLKLLEEKNNSKKYIKRS